MWNKIHPHKKKAVILIMLGLFMGILIGFYLGVDVTIRKFARVASYFIDVDYEKVKMALQQYEHHIGACYGN